MPLKLDARSPGFAASFAALVGSKRGAAANVEQAVSAILADVRARGDEAVIAYTERFDRMRLDASRMRLTKAEIDAAYAECAPETIAALRIAAARIEDYHRRLLPQDLDYRDNAGVRLGARWTPIDAVGLYVPGGTAAYPSTVLMNAMPAKVAGVPRVAMVVPTPDGKLNPLVLAAARIAGVEEIYRIGGAQAVAALAFGTVTIPAVDKIVGPGNAYVATAKRQIFGQVGIDTIAGPSEVVIVADGANDPLWIATDLLAQAEHDADAQSILITDDAGFAARVEAEIAEQLRTLPRATIAAASWQAHGAIIQIATLADAPPLVDRLAAEHVQLAVADPDALAARIRHAGAIFLGRYTPEAFGDYLAGPNHVLPTERTARFSSGLGVLDFLKRMSIIGCDAASLAKLGPVAVTLAREEGLDAHARSIAVRLPGATQ